MSSSVNATIISIIFRYKMLPKCAKLNWFFRYYKVCQRNVWCYERGREYADPRPFNASSNIKLFICSITNLFLLLISRFLHSTIHTIFSPIYITLFTPTHIDYVKIKFRKRIFRDELISNQRINKYIPIIFDKK